ncbi:hypothetical protein ACH0CV_09750 [Brachybacterium paraconglomeratum]|nr:hypothetical protein [Brachybacterium paraconglomeratum]
MPAAPDVEAALAATSVERSSQLGGIRVEEEHAGTGTCPSRSSRT